MFNGDVGEASEMSADLKLHVMLLFEAAFKKEASVPNENKGNSC